MPVNHDIRERALGGAKQCSTSKPEANKNIPIRFEETFKYVKDRFLFIRQKCREVVPIQFDRRKQILDFAAGGFRFAGIVVSQMR